MLPPLSLWRWSHSAIVSTSACCPTVCSQSSPPALGPISNTASSSIAPHSSPFPLLISVPPISLAFLKLLVHPNPWPSFFRSELGQICHTLDQLSANFALHTYFLCNSPTTPSTKANSSPFDWPALALILHLWAAATSSVDYHFGLPNSFWWC